MRNASPKIGTRMSLLATQPSGRPRSGPSTRERILGAASELFYANGIRATSADRIIEQVGVTKVTFYRHFRSKGDLVVAYLGDQSRAEKGWMASARTPGDPVASLRSLAAGIGAAGCQPGFRGCAFINAAAEFPDAADPVRAAVDAHREWIRLELTSLAEEAGVTDTETVGRQLVMLRDGAMVGGYLGDASALAESLGAAFLALVAAAA